MKLRALDLFCGAGGATKGLQRAGFHVTGVDIKPQPRYCGDIFIQTDALNPPVDMCGFDFAWASPPCQRHVRGLRNSPNYSRESHVDLIPQTRALLKASGVLFVIENVPGAPIRPDYRLNGTMFPPLRVIRERWFETSWRAFPVGGNPPRGMLAKGFLSIAGTGIQKWCLDRGMRFNVADARAAMGIDWMTRKELSQAIPPAYSEFIGRAAIAQIQQARAA